MKFSISGNMSIIEEIEAETLDKIIKKFKKRNPGVHIGSINWNTCENCIYVTGICKICGKVLVYNTFHKYMLCEECKKRWKLLLQPIIKVNLKNYLHYLKRMVFYLDL